jgi:hypothetical protein
VDEILEEADKCHADYIILGSHGHFSAQHLYNRNVFIGILKQTAFPVIMIPVEAMPKTLTALGGVWLRRLFHLITPHAVRKRSFFMTE